MNFYRGCIKDLSQDTFSNSIFGESEQLKVVGHFQEGSIKTYVVSCSLCGQDRELFQDALFTTSKGHLKINKLPCGCSSIPKWNADQQYIRVLRACSEMGYKLIDDFDTFIHRYKDQTTKITVVCDIHGERHVPLAYITSKRKCRKCVDIEQGLLRRQSDKSMINKFLASGAFHPDTIFYRSDRKTNQGAMNYWWVECPICKSCGEAISSDLKKGNQPCECFNNQRQAYINLVSDSDLPVAIKFGIAKDYKSRIPRQNKHSVYEVSNLKAWEFPSKESCILAELECKQSLDCGVISKEEFPDGFSETTYTYNIDRVTEIFEKYGGITIH